MRKLNIIKIKVMKHFTKLLLILIILAGGNFTSCKKMSAYDYPPSIVSLYEIVNQDTYKFTLLKAAIDRAGLKDTLNATKELTLFAPSNVAFTAAGYTLAVINVTPKAVLANIIRNHILSGKFDAASFTGTAEKTAAGKQKVLIQKVGTAMYVDGGNLTNLDVKATNGVMQVIDKLLLTQASILDAVNTNTNLTYLAAAIIRASTGSVNFTQLLGTGTYTLFAPSNAAFIDGGYATIAAINAANAETLVNLLKYHLLTTRKLVSDMDSLPQNSLATTPIYFDVIRNAKATTIYANGIGFGGSTANLLAGSGVIHTIPRILPIPVTTNTLQRINSDPNLTFLSAAITMANQGTGATFDFAKLLSDPLASYTIFAPNNAAFQAVGYASIAAINAESTSVIIDMLKFHMLNKRMNNINLVENATYPTLFTTKDVTTGIVSPSYITFLITGGFKVKGLSNATTIPVITGNVVTTNGLVNIIGTVLKP